MAARSRLGVRTAPNPGMRVELRTKTELRQLPGLLRYLRLLPLGHEVLAATVERALADNPMLERMPGSVCSGCGRHQTSSACPRCTGQRPTERTSAVAPFDTLEIAAGWEVRSDCRHVLPVVIAHLTGRGLLDTSPDEIAAEHGLAPTDVAEAIRAIKVAGPPGVAERSVTELLVVQARALVEAGAAEQWFIELVRDHLEEVATGEIANVAAALGVSVDEVVAAFRLVRDRLRPEAVVELHQRPHERALPDVFIYRTRSGLLGVDVPDSRWFGLGLAEVPPDLRADGDAMAWLADHERAARDLLRQIDTRGGVLRSVATYVVQRQAGYFEVGASGHIRLTRTDVAAELGLHPSTISRCVAGKAVRCPDGEIVPFAELLGGGVAVKARLADLAVTGRRSDAELVRALADSGYVVARRTVAKYRAELGIAAGGLHRTWLHPSPHRPAKHASRNPACPRSLELARIVQERR